MSQGAPGTLRAQGRRRLGAPVAVLLTVGLLAGCTTAGPDTSPAPSPSVSTPDPAVQTPSPEPTPTVQPPEWTDAMDEVTVEGALAFGEYFMQLYPYVIATGDTTEWRALSHPECVFCMDVAETVDAGEFLQGKTQIELTPVEGRELEPGYYFSLDYSVLEWPDGAADPTPLLGLFGVIRENDRWLMRVIEFQETTVQDD